jgi:hypothetical protein
MNIADTFRGFVRRWYIVLPGLIIAMVGAIGAYITVQPGYERTATQLLLPGSGIIPKDSTNPFLYLGGLTQAADIVVRVMQSEEVLDKVVDQFPGTDVVVQRDPTVSGPVVQIVVTAKSDAAAAGALDELVQQSGVVLDRLQTEQNVTGNNQMTISTLTQDTKSTLQQKTRLVVAAGVFLGLVILTLLVASLVDGLSRRARRTGRQGGRIGSGGAGDEPDPDSAAADLDLEADELDADDLAVPERDDDPVPGELETASADGAPDDEDDEPDDDRDAVVAGGRGRRGASSRSR